MTRPKLLFVVTEDWYFVSHRLQLAVAARDAGFDVAVATRVRDHGRPILEAGCRLLPISLRRSTMSPVVAAIEMRQLRHLYAAEQPDLVHHVALKPVILGSLAARGLPIKGIVNAIAGLGTSFSTESLRSRAIRIPVRAVLRLSLDGPRSRVIVQNEDDRAELTRSGLAISNHVRLIRGAGVDIAAFDVAPPPPGLLLVVFPARLLRLKGVFEFVAAARMLKARGVKARFAVVGAPDPHNPTSVRQTDIRAWREEGVVEVWGHRNDMPCVLQQAAIVCLPTYYREGLPKALIEAAAARRAIVTTDVAGARDIARNGAAGWLVPPRDATALADALDEALGSARKRDLYAAAARADAVALYDGRVIARETLAIYQELLQGHIDA